jgi:hypothetical protein
MVYRLQVNLFKYGNAPHFTQPAVIDKPVPTQEAAVEYLSSNKPTAGGSGWMAQIFTDGKCIYEYSEDIKETVNA